MVIQLKVFRKIMNEYKGIFIGFLSVFIGSLSTGLEYYGIIKVASIGVLIAFALGIYGYFIQSAIINKKLSKSDDDSNE